jgi:hypothetical protein
MQTIRIKYGQNILLYNIKKRSKMQIIILKPAAKYSISQAALALGYTYTYVWGLVKSGKLASEKSGEKNVITTKTLAEWLAVTQPKTVINYQSSQPE